jgi:hypothetical protein
MSTAHTPGPWEMSYDQGSYRDIMTKDARICTVRHGYVSRETYHANARLIAAAPELVSALISARDALEAAFNSKADGDVFGIRHNDAVDALAAARAAIAKATGGAA